MTSINLITKINAPIQTVFDSARSIDMHQLSTAQSKEKAIEGKTSGLIELNETVTFRAKHFGLYLTHKSKITQMNPPTYFVDEMEKGLFKSFKHEHFFQTENNTTLMIDRVEYETPFWILGWLFDTCVLKRYLKSFILNRNKILKNLIENQQQNQP